jgi:hypothetical protein
MRGRFVVGLVDLVLALFRRPLLLLFFVRGIRLRYPMDLDKIGRNSILRAEVWLSE